MKARFAIYDQFHWLRPDHIEVIVEGTEKEALECYQFYKELFSGESLGFTTEEDFLRLKHMIYETSIDDYHAANGGDMFCSDHRRGEGRDTAAGASTP